MIPKDADTSVSINAASGSDSKLVYLKDDWSNSDLMGSFRNKVRILLTDNNGSPLSKEFISASNGNLDLSLEYLMEIQIEDETTENPDEVEKYQGDYKMTFFLSINNQIVDFQLGEQESSNGFIQLDSPLSEIVALPLKIQNVPMKKGDNTIALMGVMYFPQIGKYGIVMPHGTFSSEADYDGKVVYAADAGEYGAQMTAANETNISDFSEGFEQNLLDRTAEYHEGKYGYFEVQSQCNMHFDVLNVKEKQVDPRGGFLVIFQNGKLIPAWNNNQILAISLSEQDALAQIPFSVKLPENAYSMIGAFYFNTSFPEDNEPFKQQCTALCHVTS